MTSSPRHELDNLSVSSVSTTTNSNNTSTDSEAYSVLSERLPNMITKETVKSKTKLKRMKNESSIDERDEFIRSQSSNSHKHAAYNYNSQKHNFHEKLGSVGNVMNNSSSLSSNQLSADSYPNRHNPGHPNSQNLTSKSHTKSKNFPKSKNLGKSNKKSSHNSAKSKYFKYTFVAYQPERFLEIRKACKINEEKFIKSLKTLDTLVNPGSSKSAFWQTQDKDFFIKTIDRIEVDNFLKMFNDYRKRVLKGSLLSQMLGVYRLKYENFDLRLVVLTNIAPSSSISMKIDVKGATNNTRKAKPGDSCLKDLDIQNYYPKGFKVDSQTAKKIREQLEKDTQVLAKHNIIGRVEQNFLALIQQNSNPN